MMIKGHPRFSRMAVCVGTRGLEHKNLKLNYTESLQGGETCMGDKRACKKISAHLPHHNMEKVRKEQSTHVV